MINPEKQWDKFWLDTAQESASDFEYDHGRTPRQRAIELMSEQELVSFIDPQPSEIIFDAGCGSGANILLVHARVGQVLAMDYNPGAVERCQKRLSDSKVKNARVMQGGITAIPLPDASVDKIICMSVLQYLEDADVLGAFKEFKRVLKKGGTVILHVKNLSSIYLRTLWAMKKIRSLWRAQTKFEYYRPFGWYRNALNNSGFSIEDYNSFNWFIIEGMPKALRSAIQKFEFEHYRRRFFNSRFIRRHGSDLKIKARAIDGKTETK